MARNLRKWPGKSSNLMVGHAVNRLTVMQGMGIRGMGIRGMGIRPTVNHPTARRLTAGRIEGIAPREGGRKRQKK